MLQDSRRRKYRYLLFWLFCFRDKLVFLRLGSSRQGGQAEIEVRKSRKERRGWCE